MCKRCRSPGSGEQCPGAPYMDMKIRVLHSRVGLLSLPLRTSSIGFVCSLPAAQHSLRIPTCSSKPVRLHRFGTQPVTSNCLFWVASLFRVGIQKRPHSENTLKWNTPHPLLQSWDGRLRPPQLLTEMGVFKSRSGHPAFRNQH